MTLDRPRLMAVLNLTPDSFSDGGALPDEHAVLRAAAAALDQGADLLDLGGVSTRPGADSVPEDEELGRVLEPIRALRGAGGTLASVPITIDTTSARVAEAALDAGATAVNDVSAATADPAMLPLVASRGCGLVLMHRLTTPQRDAYSDAYERAPVYDDVVEHVAAHLTERLDAARAAGVRPESILLDPGLGFGKTVEQNLALLHGTPRLLELGRPVLSALSRKSFVGRMMDPNDPPPPTRRLEGTLAAGVAHLLAGAAVFRIHDVAPHRGLLDAAWRVREHTQPACGGSVPIRPAESFTDRRGSDG